MKNQNIEALVLLPFLLILHMYVNKVHIVIVHLNCEFRIQNLYTSMKVNTSWKKICLLLSFSNLCFHTFNRYTYSTTNTKLYSFLTNLCTNCSQLVRLIALWSYLQKRKLKSLLLVMLYMSTVFCLLTYYLNMCYNCLVPCVPLFSLISF